MRNPGTPASAFHTDKQTGHEGETTRGLSDTRPSCLFFWLPSKARKEKGRTWDRRPHIFCLSSLLLSCGSEFKTACGCMFVGSCYGKGKQSVYSTPEEQRHSTKAHASTTPHLVRLDRRLTFADARLQGCVLLQGLCVVSVRFRQGHCL